MNTTTGYLLVVDDDPSNRDLLSDGLRDAGYSVLPAASGGEAIELLNQQNFDLVLLDIKMPEVSGLEVLEAIREQYSATRLPVIMVTGEDQSENVVKALSLGANDYVTKPVDFPVLLARIMAQLARREEVQRKRAELERAKQELEQRLQETSRRLPWSALWITSAKGCTGKTTLAVNLAIALAEDGHAPVALLDLGSSETGVIMSIQPKRSLSDLFHHLTQVGDDILHDSQTMGECAAEHASGVTLFSMYRQSDYTRNEGIADTAVRAIIGRLKTKYNCLVVDSPSLHVGYNLQLFSEADMVLVLTGNSTVLELRETKALLEAFNKKLPDTRMELVSCCASDGLIDEAEVEKRLDKVAYFSIPREDSVVTTSINLGTPIMVSAPESRIAQSIRDLARKLAGDTAVLRGKESGAMEGKGRKKGWSLFGSR